MPMELNSAKMVVLFQTIPVVCFTMVPTIPWTQVLLVGNHSYLLWLSRCQ